MTALPTEYLTYAGLKEGFLLSEPGWFRLWAPDTVAQQNHNYDVAKRAHGFVAFGSTGGGDIFAFDQHLRVCVLPLVGLTARAATVVAESWAEFVRLIDNANVNPAAAVPPAPGLRATP